MKRLSKKNLSWLIQSGEKKNLINFCTSVINSPDFCVRDKLNASKIIVQCNGQNIDLSDNVTHDNQLKIIIEHESPLNEIESQLVTDLRKRIKGEDA